MYGESAQSPVPGPTAAIARSTGHSPMSPAERFNVLPADDDLFPDRSLSFPAYARSKFSRVASAKAVARLTCIPCL
jgi:hypothetical protein